MNIHFDSKVADEVGVNSAIMLENLFFWIKKNEINNKHFYDGYYWTYNSNVAFSNFFTFWTPRQIRTILDKLENDGYILKGNYNKAAYDKTLWYALTEKSLTLLKSQIEMTEKSKPTTEKSNGKDNKVEPIPDIITDKITDKKIYINIIEYLNEKTNSNYKHNTKATKDIINARLKEKYTLEDFKTVIDIKCNSWLNTEYEKYLRPQTLFGNKFESYLNEKPNKPEIGYNNKERDYVPVNEINSEMMKHLENDF